MVQQILLPLEQTAITKGFPKEVVEEIQKALMLPLEDYTKRTRQPMKEEDESEY